MGVDWYVCNNCGESFPDCGDYVYCECGEHWCSQECANKEGYLGERCGKGLDIEDNECDMDCCDCDDFVEESSCSYCRYEKFDDSTLLIYALELMSTSKEELIEGYKSTIKKTNK